MHQKQKKFEHPDRVAELNPSGTLKKIGLSNQMTFCDIGAGTGIFTMSAAKLTDAQVYALEIDQDMVDLINEKAQQTGQSNVEVRLVENGLFPLSDSCVDLALMVTVLHEIPDPIAFLAETKRILKQEGRVAVIEFHKRDTPSGPPIPHRIEQERVVDLFFGIGFEPSVAFDLGKNYYCIVFTES